MLDEIKKVLLMPYNSQLDEYNDYKAQFDELKDTIYTKGCGSISLISGVNNCPLNCLYIAKYPYTVIHIGIIDPNAPNSNPSNINGIFILIFDAPTSLIISISLFLEKIVILIVFVIKKAVTTIKAATIIIHNFLTQSNAETKLSTIPSPYLTTVAPSIVFI